MDSWLTPLYDAEGIRAIDRWAIERQGVPEAELMEAAGTALAEAVAGLAPRGPVRIVRGKGNNGGDGLVAARRLAAMGFGGGGSRRLAGRLRRGRRRDLRHRLRWRASRAGRGGDRGDRSLRGAGRRL
jgi:hypothetical protein